MNTPDEIITLLRTVAGLPRDDQHRILRLVDLLSLAPYSVQQRTHTLLRGLLDSDPQTKHECVARVDQLIGYLEHCVAADDERVPGWNPLHHSFVRGTTQ